MQKRLTPTAKLVCSIVAAVLVAVVISLLPASELLSRQALTFLGIFAGFIILVASNTVALHVGVLIALMALILTGTTDFPTAFSAFSSNLVWLIVAIMGFGEALQASGLFNRIALMLMKLFPNTFKGQVAALTVGTAVMGPTIPANAVKGTIMLNVAKSMAESVGYQKNSRQMAGLCAAVFLPAFYFSCAFITGESSVPTMLSLLPESNYNFVSWLGVTAVYGIVVLVLGFLAVLFFYKPKKGELGSVAPSGPNPAIAQLEELGPMSRQEKATLVVFIVAVCLWLTEGIHGVPLVITTMCALLAMTLLGIFKPADYTTKIPWYVVIIVGGIMCMASLFTSTGVTGWISATLGPVLGPIGTNIWLLVPVVFLFTFLIRYVIVSIMGATIISFAIFGGIAAAAGINPVVVVFTAYMAASCYQTSYNFMPYIILSGISSQMCDYKHLQQSAYIAAGVQLIACIASIPLWMFL